MPFEAIETHHRENQPPTVKLAYWPFEGKHGARKDAQPRLVITVPTTVCGVSKAERFVLQVGTGKDAGKLRIVSANKGEKQGVKPSEHAHFLKFNFGYVPKLGDDKIAEHRYPVSKISDDVFEITVPASWFGDVSA